MEFYKSKGALRDTEKLGYRVTRSRIPGLPTRYYACVRVVREDGTKWWNFCQHRRPYKTQKKAIEACEFNRRLWEAVIKLSEASGNRRSRLEALIQRGKKDGGDVLLWVPHWVRSKVDPVLLRMLSPYSKPCKSPSDDSEVSESTPPSDSVEVPGPDSSSSITPDDSPASSATAAEQSTTRTTRRARSKETSSATESSARAAKGRSSGRKPNTKRSTKPASKGSKRTRKDTAA